MAKPLTLADAGPALSPPMRGGDPGVYSPRLRGGQGGGAVPRIFAAAIFVNLAIRRPRRVPVIDFGDSLTAGYGLNRRSPRLKPRYRLGSTRVVNAGVSEIPRRGLGARLGARRQARSGDLALGANDALRGIDPRPSAAASTR